jgi:hypothetical protein
VTIRARTSLLENRRLIFTALVCDWRISTLRTPRELPSPVFPAEFCVCLGTLPYGPATERL